MDRPDLPPGLVGRGGHIFGNVNLLYEKHLQFLPALEACKNTDEIADCFLKHVRPASQYFMTQYSIEKLFDCRTICSNCILCTQRTNQYRIP